MAKVPDSSWPSDLDVHVAMLDTQHRKLDLLCRKLAIAFREGLAHEVIVGICLEVKKYSDFHFLCEENLMRSIGYPGSDGHARRHAQLIFELDLWVQRVHARRDTPGALIVVLRDWIVEHVAHDDRALADYVLRSEARLVATPEFGLYRR
ncbi:MAG: hemerythrin family protein [Steroidobacteraceae bacterium]